MVSFFDSVAQLVEQLTLNQWVEGSSPSGVTRKSASRLIKQHVSRFSLSRPQHDARQIEFIRKKVGRDKSET